MTRLEWTAPCFGIQHFPNGPTEPDSSHWVTVEDCGTFAKLLCWSPGCFYRPLVYVFGTADEARWAGEAYALSDGHVSPKKEAVTV